eukprot:2461827-Alexandrium_andersonii.AAC.1
MRVMRIAQHDHTSLMANTKVVRVMCLHRRVANLKGELRCDLTARIMHMRVMPAENTPGHNTDCAGPKPVSYTHLRAHETSAHL